MAMKISIGPLAYFWDKDRTINFYRELEQAPVDIVYLGETTCSKRRELSLDDWMSIAERLDAAGKEVVLSTLTLVEAESELSMMKRITQNGHYIVEANDMAAVELMKDKPFIMGPHINCYNSASLQLLADKGAIRWVVPVELGRETIQAFQEHRPAQMETEVLAFGRLPLAFSARCYTARSHDKPKDSCDFICNKYPDGLPMFTQDDVAFLVLNGISTQSAKTQNLLAALPELTDLGVDIIRLMPQSNGMLDIINAYRDRIEDNLSLEEGLSRIKPYMPFGMCDGYWYENEGLALSDKSLG